MFTSLVPQRIGDLGEPFSSPSGSWRDPAAKRFFVHFELKMKYLAMTGLKTFPVPALPVLLYLHVGTQHCLFVPTERHTIPKVDHINFEMGASPPYFHDGGAWPDWSPWIRQCLYLGCPTLVNGGPREGVRIFGTQPSNKGGTYTLGAPHPNHWGEHVPPAPVSDAHA